MPYLYRGNITGKWNLSQIGHFTGGNRMNAPIRRLLLSPASNLKLLSLGCLLICAVALLTLSFIPLAKTVWFNSDDASLILEARDVFNGNWFLKDWYLSSESYYTTDVIFHAIAVAVFGFSDKLLYIVPCMIFSLIVILASFLAGLTDRGHFSYKNAVVTFVLLICFSRTYEYYLRGPIHTGGMMYVLVCLILLYYEDAHPKLFTGLFTFVLTLALTGDSFVLYFFVIPLVFVQFLEFFNDYPLKPSFYASLLSIGLAYILSKSLGLLGLKVMGLDSMKFVPIDNFTLNMALFFKGILRLYNLSFFGQELKSLTTLRLLAYGLVTAGLLFSVYGSFWGRDRVKKILATACALVCLEYLLSNRPEIIWMPWVPDTTRYLFPVFVFSLILAGKNIAAFLTTKRKKILVTMLLAVVFLSFGHTYIRAVNSPDPSQAETDLIAFLANNDLTAGYGGFWSANIITLKSHERVKIYAIKYEHAEKSVKPYLWLSKKDWYRQPVNFVILDNRRPLHDGGINYAAIVHAFGFPQELYVVGVYTILVWDKDISEYMFAYTEN